MFVFRSVHRILFHVIQKLSCYIALSLALLIPPFGLASQSAIAQSQLGLIDEIFQAGDTLSVKILNVESLTKEYDIDENGQADFLYLGKIKVEGLSTTQVALQLEDLYSQNHLNNPHITVTRIPAWGESSTPTATPAPQTDMAPLQGPEIKQSPSNSQDESPSSPALPISEFLFPSPPATSVTQTPRSSAIIRPSSSAAPTSYGRFMISGDVGEPGVYTLSENQPISVLLQRAGGTNKTADLDEVIVFRSEQGGRRNIYFVKYSSVLLGDITDPIIIPGDFIFIKSRDDDFEWSDVEQILALIDLPLDIALQR